MTLEELSSSSGTLPACPRFWPGSCCSSDPAFYEGASAEQSGLSLLEVPSCPPRQQLRGNGPDKPSEHSRASHPSHVPAGGLQRNCRYTEGTTKLVGCLGFQSCLCPAGKVNICSKAAAVAGGRADGLRQFAGSYSTTFLRSGVQAPVKGPELIIRVSHAPLRIAVQGACQLLHSVGHALWDSVARNGALVDLFPGGLLSLGFPAPGVGRALHHPRQRRHRL